MWFGEGVRGSWSVICLLFLEEVGCFGWYGYLVFIRFYEGRSFLGVGVCLG